eukprot:500811_1
MLEEFYKLFFVILFYFFFQNDIIQLKKNLLISRAKTVNSKGNAGQRFQQKNGKKHSNKANWMIYGTIQSQNANTQGKIRNFEKIETKTNNKSIGKKKKQTKKK